MNFAVSGTATLSTDYSHSGYTFCCGSVTFGPGETTKTVTLTALLDVPADSGETATLTLTAGPTTGAGVYVIGAPTAGTVTIVDTPVPIPEITLAATDNSATEGGDTGTYTFTRTGGNTAAALSVFYTISGSAVVNSDYTTTGQDFQGQLTFAAGQTSKTLTLTANVDAQADTGETATMTLAAGPASGAAVYAIGAPSSGTVTIISP